MLLGFQLWHVVTASSHVTIRLADREERMDNARMAERLERLKLERENTTEHAISSITLVAAQ